MSDESLRILSTCIHQGFDAERLEFALNYYRHLKGLQEYVDNHRHEPFQLTNVAEAVGISSSRLSHLFLDKTGVSFSEWLRYERVKRAVTLLASDDKSISEIAYSVGYRNSRTFERSFRKATGVSPSQFRKTYETQVMSLD